MADHARNADTREIQTFFDTDFEKHRVWRPEELGAILEHQWQAPLSADLGGQSRRQAGQLKLLCEADNLLLKSYGDVFAHRVPPIELLEMIKSFAKRNLAHSDAALPREIATLLYVLSVVAARVRCGYRITSRDDDAVRRNIEAVLEQPWLTSPVRELLHEGLRAFSAGENLDEERSEQTPP